MSLRAKIEIAVAIAILIAAVVGARTWLAEHDARLKAEASIAAAQKSADQAAAQTKQLVDADKTRDAQTATTIAKLSEAAASQKTPQQIVKWIPEQLGPLPAPIAASIPAPTPQVPVPDAVVDIPQSDLGPLRDEIASCQRNAVALSGAQGDLSSCQSQLKLAQQQTADADKERDAYKEDLKGGTFWHRVKSGAKMLAIGGAIGIATACGTGHCK
jgi:hypothetical protein